MKIMIGVDDSPHSRAAVEFVRKMTWPRESRVLVVSAVFAPWLAPRDPGKQSLVEKRTKPGGKFLLGTDEVGTEEVGKAEVGTAEVQGFSWVLLLPLGDSGGPLEDYIYMLLVCHLTGIPPFQLPKGRALPSSPLALTIAPCHATVKLPLGAPLR